MTDEPDDTLAGEGVPDPLNPAPATPPVDAIRALGFDPDLVQAVVLTPTSVVAIAIDYPEPYTAPQEETPDGH